MGRLLRVRSQGGMFTTAYRRGPEVALWEVTTPSGVFQSKVVVHRLAEFLREFAARLLNLT